MKVRSFVLNGTINAKRIKQLIAKIEVCKAKNINLYLSTIGGDCAFANIFIDFTKRTEKKIHIIGSEMMASCGVDLFIESKGKKSISDHTCALLHFNTLSHESRNALNKKSYESVMLKELRKENEIKLKTYEAVFELSPREKSLLRNGGDLGIDYERLKKSLSIINL